MNNDTSKQLMLMHAVMNRVNILTKSVETHKDEIMDTQVYDVKEAIMNLFDHILLTVEESEPEFEDDYPFPTK